MDQHEEPPRLSLAALAEALERSRADMAAGRIVSGESVLADLEAGMKRLAEQQPGKVTDAA